MTYSIVARDSDTGELGVAVQSHWFSVGSIVAWARPGVGAVATQSVAEPAYGPRLLERLATGELPADALGAELAADEEAEFRQVAVIDGEGRVAVHTGGGCIEAAGETTGDGFSTQANMMASPGVWPAMAAAYEEASGPLERRLLAALEAAEREGGDLRGRQSAALVVVAPEGEPWATKVDLRVEDSVGPLDELARLLDLHDAYELAGRADSLAAAGDHDQAARLYVAAADVAPGSEELAFWAGLGLAAAGDLERGAERIAGLISADDRWRVLLERLDARLRRQPQQSANTSASSRTPSNEQPAAEQPNLNLRRRPVTSERVHRLGALLLEVAPESLELGLVDDVAVLGPGERPAPNLARVGGDAVDHLLADLGVALHELRRMAAEDAEQVVEDEHLAVGRATRRRSRSPGSSSAASAPR